MEVRAPPHYYYYYYYYRHRHHHHHLIRTIPTTTNNNNNVKIFNSTETFKNVFVLKFELILIIGSNNVLTEGARKVYRGRRVGQG
jgi:Ca2+/Na+ antiporter